MSNYSFSCPNCKFRVLESQNSIYCDSCCNWYHLKCSGLTRRRFIELGNDASSTWFCKDCVEDALPFQKLKNPKFLREIRENQIQYSSITDANRYCSCCNKRVNKIETAMLCSHCRSFIHRKCSGLTEQQFYNLGVEAKHWFCGNCRNNIFPFNTIETHDILLDNFNYNEVCPCKDKTKDFW